MQMQLCKQIHTGELRLCKPTAWRCFAENNGLWYHCDVTMVCMTSQWCVTSCVFVHVLQSGGTLENNLQCHSFAIGWVAFTLYFASVLQRESTWNVILYVFGVFVHIFLSQNCHWFPMCCVWYQYVSSGRFPSTSCHVILQIGFHYLNISKWSHLGEG